MSVKLITAKWHIFLPVINICLLFAISLIKNLLDHQPVISIVHSGCWLIAGIVIFVFAYKEASEQDENRRSGQQVKNKSYTIKYKDFSDQTIAENIFSVITNLSILIVVLFFLWSRFYDFEQVINSEKSNISLFNDLSNILFAIYIIFEYTVEILEAKTRLTMIICGFFVLLATTFLFMSTKTI